MMNLMDPAGFLHILLQAGVDIIAFLIMILAYRRKKHRVFFTFLFILYNVADLYTMLSHKEVTGTILLWDMISLLVLGVTLIFLTIKGKGEVHASYEPAEGEPYDNE